VTHGSNSPDGYPDWYNAGIDHIWLPYTQMQTTPAPLAVAATDGVRLKLADGRELIDGVSSWWTACHGYNHPHIRTAIANQMTTMPHMMFGGLVNPPALTLARRFEPRFLCRFWVGVSRSGDEDGGAILDQPGKHHAA
jgi:adenosylmethionine-8-amino-7-oxononanoate aminotransferase